MSEEIRINLLKVINLLKREGETSWALRFKNALKCFDDGDKIECARIVLSGFGRMGSLSDVVLEQTKDERGQFAWKADYVEINEEFQRLLGELVKCAVDIRSGKQSQNNGALQ